MLYWVVLLGLVVRASGLEQTIVFNVETDSSVGMVELNSSLLADMVLWDSSTNTTVALYALSAATSQENGVQATRLCDNTSFYNANTSQCQTCQVCAHFRLQACAAGADTVCDTSCPAGAMLWHNLCTLCAPGQFAAVAGGVSCALCAAGSYANTAGQSACSACAAGFTSKPGATTCIKVKKLPLKWVTNIYVAVLFFAYS